MTGIPQLNITTAAPSSPAPSVPPDAAPKPDCPLQDDGQTSQAAGRFPVKPAERRRCVEVAVDTLDDVSVTARTRLQAVRAVTAMERINLEQEKRDQGGEHIHVHQSHWSDKMSVEQLAKLPVADLAAAHHDIIKMQSAFGHVDTNDAEFRALASLPEEELKALHRQVIDQPPDQGYKPDETVAQRIARRIAYARQFNDQPPEQSTSEPSTGGQP